MSELCYLSNLKTQVADFVCPTNETRDEFNADFIIFMNTITTSRFENTNTIFEKPEIVDFVVNEWGDVESQVNEIIQKIDIQVNKPVFDWKEPTGLMIGRFQPFHDGHLKLFEKILEKEGQVVIAVRNTHQIDEKNPFDFFDVSDRIYETLTPKYEGKFEVIFVPNITGVYYGRDVGYKVEQIKLDEATEAISATNIRKQMGL
jgi:cytidyltransferase-like protein